MVIVHTDICQPPSSTGGGSGGDGSSGVPLSLHAEKTNWNQVSADSAETGDDPEIYSVTPTANTITVRVDDISGNGATFLLKGVQE